MRALALVSVVVCALVTSTPSHAAPAASLKHIRPRDPDAALLLRVGTERSTRFREIVGQLERSNVIVYIDVRMSPPIPSAAGSPSWGRQVVIAGCGRSSIPAPRTAAAAIRTSSG